MGLVADALGRCGARIDFAERRRRLVGLPMLDEQTWLAICRRAGCAPGHERRRRFATIWLWCELTGGASKL